MTEAPRIILTITFSIQLGTKLACLVSDSTTCATSLLPCSSLRVKARSMSPISWVIQIFRSHLTPTAICFHKPRLKRLKSLKNECSKGEKVRLFEDCEKRTEMLRLRRV